MAGQLPVMVEANLAECERLAATAKTLPGRNAVLFSHRRSRQTQGPLDRVGGRDTYPISFALTFIFRPCIRKAAGNRRRGRRSKGVDKSNPPKSRSRLLIRRSLIEAGLPRTKIRCHSHRMFIY
jgi:hypothetical protein